MHEMHQIFKFIVFCSSTLHVSDGLSVHHQESKTLHTASDICQTDFVDCLLAGTRWNGMDLPFHLVFARKKVAVSVLHVPEAVCTVLDS
jgi:hypothetical protein